MSASFDFDDPGPPPTTPPSRLRRAASIALVVLIIASMVFLAWVSGRGVISVSPEAPATPVPSADIARIPVPGSVP